MDSRSASTSSRSSSSAMSSAAANAWSVYSLAWPASLGDGVAAGQVSRGRCGNLTPVIAGGVRRVDHSVVILPAPPLLLDQPPGLVEQLSGQQLLVGDAAGPGRAPGSRFTARWIPLGHGDVD